MKPRTACLEAQYAEMPAAPALSSVIFVTLQSAHMRDHLRKTLPSCPVWRACPPMKLPEELVTMMRPLLRWTMSGTTALSVYTTPR